MDPESRGVHHCIETRSIVALLVVSESKPTSKSSSVTLIPQFERDHDDAIVITFANDVIALCKTMLFKHLAAQSRRKLTL